MDWQDRYLEIDGLEQLPWVMEELKSTLQGFEIPREKQLDLQLCLMEAVSNGVIHGNQQLPGKKVKIHWRNDAHTFLFEVEDEGTGIPTVQQIPVAETNVMDLSEHGRGLLLLQAILNEVWFNERGNIICGKLHW